MNYNNLDFTVIIPHRNSIGTLLRLFDSIPAQDKIEIILVDNTPTPVTRGDIGISRNYTLLSSECSRGAGGARNVGIENARGKWLLFADADDFYTEDAFDTFNRYIDSDSEVIYFGMGGMNNDTGEYSPRGEIYTKMVRKYLSGEIDEYDIRLHFHTPCSKMVRKKLVIRYNLRYSEVPVGNDAYFAMMVGYHASKIDAVDKITYIATVIDGSLTRRNDYEAFKSRYLEDLKINQFLRKHRKKSHQYPIMGNIIRAKIYGLNKSFELLKLAIQHRQNLFVGIKDKIMYW